MAHQLKGDTQKAEAVFAKVTQLNEDTEAQHPPFAVQVAAEEDLAVAIALANSLSDRKKDWSPGLLGLSDSVDL
jgi:hypothetical protein